MQALFGLHEKINNFAILYISSFTKKGDIGISNNFSLAKLYRCP